MVQAPSRLTENVPSVPRLASSNRSELVLFEEVRQHAVSHA